MAHGTIITAEGKAALKEGTFAFVSQLAEDQVGSGSVPLGGKKRWERIGVSRNRIRQVQHMHKRCTTWPPQQPSRPRLGFLGPLLWYAVCELGTDRNAGKRSSERGRSSWCFFPFCQKQCCPHVLLSRRQQQPKVASATTTSSRQVGLWVYVRVRQVETYFFMKSLCLRRPVCSIGLKPGPDSIQLFLLSAYCPQGPVPGCLAGIATGAAVLGAVALKFVRSK